MTRRERVRHQHGQGALEYAVLFMAVILVIVFGQVYFKRALSGRFKDTSDQIGEQFTTGRNYITQTIQQSYRREKSGDVDLVNGVYSESKVLPRDRNLDDAVPDLRGVLAAANYANAEVTRRDFVKDVLPGGQALGNHGVFDSGDLRSTNLFSD